ncbi:MAG: hypothetical protein C4522_18670 [Desulfobacteraceae bacterium]|nr:MAG: hypothetical protein C4522_18670 [Desulfobacteraceae bacterium]
MKYTVFSIFFLVLLFFSAAAPHGAQVKPAQNFYPSPSYEVENLEAVLHQAGLFSVSGEIRNTDAHPTIGYVVIYFSNDKDEVIAEAETIVNDKKAIEPGNTGHFKFSQKIDEYKRITKTFIEYVVQEKIVSPKKPLIIIGTKR